MSSLFPEPEGVFIIVQRPPQTPPLYAYVLCGGIAATGYGGCPLECLANACENWLAWAKGAAK